MDQTNDTQGNVTENNPIHGAQQPIQPGMTPPKKRKTGLWIGVTAAVVVVVGGGAVTASAMNVFASGKNLLKYAVGKSIPTASNPQPVEENIHFTLKNLTLPSDAGAVAQALGSNFNNASLDLGVQFDQKAELAKVDFNTQYQGKTHHGSMWANSNQVILSLADYQDLLSSLLSSSVGMTMNLHFPQYLLTDDQQKADIQNFWSQLNSTKSMSNDEQQAVTDLAEQLINGIPDQYINRSGLTGVEIKFDQAGLEDIVKSEIKNVYSNKGAFAKDIAVIEHASDSSMSVADEQKSILDSLNQQPEDTVLSQVSTAFASKVITIEKPITLDMSRGLFGGGVKETFEGGISVKDPNSDMAFTLEFNGNAGPLSGTIQMPGTNSQNSQTFTQFEQSLMGAAGQ